MFEYAGRLAQSIIIIIIIIFFFYLLFFIKLLPPDLAMVPFQKFFTDLRF